MEKPIFLTNSKTVVLSTYGYEFGPMSITSVIVNLSFLIPTIYACVTDGVPIRWNLFVGFALILGLFTVIALPQKGSKAKKILPIWFLIVLIAFFSNGITAVIQKYFGATFPDGNLPSMMSVAYATAALIFAVCFVVLAFKNPNARPNGIDSVKVLGLSLIAGGGSFGGNYLLGLLCNAVNGSILYPCLNGGLCILCSIISFIFFKEKLYRNKVIAILLGVAAIIVLNL